MRQTIVPRQALLVAVLLSIFLISPPASAQDLFGFLKLFSAPVEREPVYRPYELRSAGERRAIRRPKKVARGDAHPTKVPIRPKVPGEVANPVTELLTDRTLRRGDLVMFPEGFRVFNGQPGSMHALTDFVKVSRAGSVVPSSTRKLLASVRPDSNPAWSTERPNSGGELTGNTKDVEVTGNLGRKRR
jgi:hypothetical protein